MVLINKSYVDSSLVTHPLWLEERKDKDGKILPAGPADHPKAMAEIFGRLNDSDRNRALSFRNKGGATAFFRSMSILYCERNTDAAKGVAIANLNSFRFGDDTTIKKDCDEARDIETELLAAWYPETSIKIEDLVKLTVTQRIPDLEVRLKVNNDMDIDAIQLTMTEQQKLNANRAGTAHRAVPANNANRSSSSGPQCCEHFNADGTKRIKDEYNKCNTCDAFKNLKVEGKRIRHDHKYGHPKFCKAKRSEQANSAKVVTTDMNDENKLINLYSRWLLDSGCSSHMTSQEELFNSLTPDNTLISTAKKSQTIQAKAKGTITISQNNFLGNITNVLLVPKLEDNLLSVSALTRRGCDISFKEKEVEISLNGQLLFTGQRCQNLYVVKFQHRTVANLASTNASTIDLENSTPADTLYGCFRSWARVCVSILERSHSSTWCSTRNFHCVPSPI